MSINQKRSRSLNWDEEEKQLFRAVFKEFASVIENKALDNNTNKLKSNAWEEVHKKFNELNGRLRSLSQLKIQWKSMKIKARKDMGSFKQTINKTGGGARPQTPSSDTITISDLLNPAELLRDENIYDSDGITLTASSSKNLSASETQIFTLQDVTENWNLTICENIHSENQEAGSMSLVTEIEDHISAASQQSKDPESDVRQDSIAQEAITPKNKFKRIKKIKRTSKAPSCSAKGNYVATMIDHTKFLKDKEHEKRMEILEVELQIQKEKLKSAAIEREIFEIRRAKELK